LRRRVFQSVQPLGEESPLEFLTKKVEKSEEKDENECPVNAIEGDATLPHDPFVENKISIENLLFDRISKLVNPAKIQTAQKQSVFIHFYSIKISLNQLYIVN
jgi:hypothetical protein